MSSNETLIIAEAGINHNGDLQKAKDLIDVAVEAGADYVKFQTFKSELNISANAAKAVYQKALTDKNESQLEMAKKLELTYAQFEELNNYCKNKGIKFLSTAFDLPSIDFINDLVDFFKVPSGEITNYPYLKKISQLKKPVVLSTGMATLQEIKQALDVLTSFTLEKNYITVLHCNTEYPTPMKDVNLKAMTTIRDQLDIKIGYSDHTIGIEVPVAAVALGACVIEKHFTLDRNLPGPDHKSSLEPKELKEMVKAIRNVEMALSGSGKKVPSTSEEKNIPIARKSIHLVEELKAGEILEDKHLIALRPGNGISPMRWNEIIGKRLLFTRPKYYQITQEDIK